MRRHPGTVSLAALFACAALFALPSAAAASSDPEDGAICTDVVEGRLDIDDCADACIDGDFCNPSLDRIDGSRQRNCRQYNHDLGLCPDPEICVSDYEYTFVQTLGVWDEDDYFANTCTLYSASQYMMHDKKQCPGHEQDVPVCFQGPTGAPQ